MSVSAQRCSAEGRRSGTSGESKNGTRQTSGAATTAGGPATRPENLPALRGMPVPSASFPVARRARPQQEEKKPLELPSPDPPWRTESQNEDLLPDMESLRGKPELLASSSLHTVSPPPGWFILRAPQRSQLAVRVRVWKIRRTRGASSPRRALPEDRQFLFQHVLSVVFRRVPPKRNGL